MRGTTITFGLSPFNEHGLSEGGEEKGETASLTLGASVSGMHTTVEGDLEQLNEDSVRFDSLSVR